MKKFAIAMAVAAVVLTAGIGSASAGNSRQGIQTVSQFSSAPSAAAHSTIGAELPRPTGKMIRDCDGDGICSYYDCYETDSQSVCDFITWCNPGGACWPT